MRIQVLGSGCPTCKNLHKAVEEVVEKLNLDLKVEYSTDISQIVELGAMSSPVFAINGKLISSGKVPTAKEIEEAILTEQKGDSAGIYQSSKGGCCCGGNC